MEHLIRVLPSNNRLSCKGLPGTNTSSLRAFLNYGCKKFYHIGLQDNQLQLQVYPHDLVKGHENNRLNFSVHVSRNGTFPELGDGKVKIFFETSAFYLNFEGDEVSRL